MLNHPKVAKAVAFATKIHEGQVRPGGDTQIDHVLRVAERTASFVGHLPADEAVDCVCTAVLHDAIEDTSATHKTIADLFGKRVANVVQAVSHEEEEEPDEVYLSRVADGGPLAVIVKRSDRLDNLDTLRHAPAEFRERKLAEVSAALPIWYRIDPEGAPLIEELLKEVENETTAS